MSLLAAYLELNRARGATDATDGDLFHPDLAVELPAPAEPPVAMDDAVLAKALAHQRALYQQGLLKTLRGGETGDAFRQMQAAVAAIESMQAGTPNRPFWCAACRILRRACARRSRPRRGCEAAPRQGRPAGEAADRRRREGAREALPRPAPAGRAQPAVEPPDHAAQGGLRAQRAARSPAARAGRGARRGGHGAHPRAARAHGPAEGHLAQVHLGQPRRPRAVRQAGAGAGRPRRAASAPRAPARLPEARRRRAGAEGARHPALRGAGPGGRDRAPVHRVGARELLPAWRRLRAPGADGVGPAEGRDGGRGRPAHGHDRGRDPRRDDAPRPGEAPRLPGRAGSPGEPAGDRAGPGRLLPRPRQARRAQGAFRPVRAGPGRADDHGARRRGRAQRRGGRARPAVRGRHAGRQGRGGGAGGRRAFGARPLHHGDPAGRDPPRGSAASRPGALRPGPFGRAPRRRGDAQDRHRVAARPRRAEAEGPGPLRGLEGGARRRREGEARARGRRPQARRRRHLGFAGGAAERGGPRGPAGGDRRRADGSLPGDPGARPREAAGDAHGAGRPARGRSRRGDRQGAPRHLPGGGDGSLRDDRRATSPVAATRRTTANRSRPSAAASTRSRAAAAWSASPTWARSPGSASR